MGFLEVICDFSWIFRGPRKFFVFFVSFKILRGPGFVAFILRPMGVDLFEGQKFCFFSWIFRGFALLCLPFTVVRFFVFFRGFFVNLCYSGFLFRQSDFSFFSWIFREFALLWLPFAALRFFVFFVPPTPSLIGVFTSGGPGTKNRCRTEMTLTNF